MIGSYDSADDLIAEVNELLGLEVAIPRKTRRGRRAYGEPRGGGRSEYFTKAASDDDSDDAPAAHATVKAEHHEQLARLYQRVAGQHRSMADHYKDGAQGAHKDDSEAEDADIAALKVLQTAAIQGDDVAARLKYGVEAELASFEVMKRAVKACRARGEFSDPSAAGFAKVRAGEPGRSP